jgi:glyoxylase-like metal-dependent hydrolase (beta-lactamase superfamily II)
VSLFGHTLQRPVTVPPAFVPEEMLASLERMRTLRPAHLAFTHFGRHDDPAAVFDTLEATLRGWDRIARVEGLEAAGEAVRLANLPAPGTPPEDLWRQIAEMNRRGFVQAYAEAERE